MLDVLQGKNMTVSPNAINSPSLILTGDPSTGRGVSVLPPGGPDRMFNRDYLNGDKQDIKPYLESINAKMSADSGVFADHWSKTFIDSWDESDNIRTILDSDDATLLTSFATGHTKDKIYDQIKTVSRMIVAREARGVNRDAFMIHLGGFDHQ
mmetsp:Transcript_57144/g.170333  ORF Transcript_57144/g.170333 Transcript_57144/m.170333 type:complete len:153 (+) Transcript_57144:129-587(+)